ncbi:MAG: hypothetical protein N3F63_06085 [Thermoplasmata archaeon]|nr:hypothetical protein [Thermoplasmata archaeon]
MIPEEALLFFINNELRKRRWFGQKLEKINVEIEDRLPAYSSENLIVEFFLLKTKPGGKRYFVPIAFTKSAFQMFEANAAVHTVEMGEERVHIFEAEYLDVFPSLIYKMFEEGAKVSGKKAEVKFVLRRNIRGERVQKGEVIGRDTTNINLKVITTERMMVLKTYRVFDVDNPEVEMLLQLSGLRNVPQVLGYAEVSIGKKVANGFLLVEYLGSVGDGIKAFMKDASFLVNGGWRDGTVVKHSEGLAFKLGEITAEVHAHLVGEDERFRPEEITSEDVERWKVRIARNLDYCIGKIQKLPETGHGEAVRKIAGQIEKRKILEDLEVAWEFVGELKIRTHQDYHLGQVLYGREENFYVLDFEGEPGRKGSERREKLPPLRDVATMLRSFAYLKHIAFRNYLEERLSIAGDSEMVCWAPAVLAGINVEVVFEPEIPEILNSYERKVGDRFARAYLQRMRELDSTLVPEKETVEKMLKFWKIEKAVYELKYELEYRLDYAGIPMEGILREIGVKN